MKIESIIKRDPPTEVVLGDTTYQFKPDSQGRHVAEVTDKHHIARLLSISEGFQLADSDEKLPKSVTTELHKAVEERTQSQKVLEPVSEYELKGSTVHPATIDLGDGQQTSIDDVIAEAHSMSGMTTAEWNGMPDEARHSLIDAALDALSGEQDDPANPSTPPAAETPAPAAEPVDAKAERDVLAAQWKARTGSLPHYKWSIEKIREELAKPSEEGK